MNDAVNAFFECGGFIAVAMNCWKTHKDRGTRGIAPLAVAFFTAWGFWNLYYYPSVGSTISGAAAIAVALANTLWISLMLYHGRAEPK